MEGRRGRARGHRSQRRIILTVQSEFRNTERSDGHRVPWQGGPQLLAYKTKGALSLDRLPRLFRVAREIRFFMVLEGVDHAIFSQTQ